MARARDTYRAARRNACIRELKGMWGPQWYYGAHNNAPRWAVAQGLSDLNKGAIYVPSWGRKGEGRKIARGKGDIYAMLKSGEFAKATKAFFSKKRHRRSTGIGGG